MNNQPRFEAVPYTDDPLDGWSVHQDGALVYEEMTEWEAKTAAAILNEQGDMTWDELETLLEEALRRKRVEDGDAITRSTAEWLRQAAMGINEQDGGAQQFRIGCALIAIAKELHAANQKPGVLLIQTEASARLYDPQTGIQYGLRYWPLQLWSSNIVPPINFSAINATATADDNHPHVWSDGEEGLEWWRQIVEHYRAQNRLAQFRYDQAIAAEQKAGSILREWRKAKEDAESVPSARSSDIPF